MITKMKFHYFISVFILLLVATACGNKQKENLSKERETAEVTEIDNRIDSISVLYYNYLFDSATPIKPTEIQLDIPQFGTNRKGVLDALITDSARIRNIKIRLDSLKPLQQSSPLDARLVATIKYKDGRHDELCFGGKYLNEIFLNGIQLEADNQLLFILKNYIGFYPWMIGDDMFAMKELQDPSFPKAPFISTAYYANYQKALAEK